MSLLIMIEDVTIQDYELYFEQKLKKYQKRHVTYRKRMEFLDHLKAVLEIDKKCKQMRSHL